jgi:hypothetical protein
VAGIFEKAYIPAWTRPSYSYSDRHKSPIGRNGFQCQRHGHLPSNRQTGPCVAGLIQKGIHTCLDTVVIFIFRYFNHDDIALSIYIQDFQSACIVGLHLATIEESSITKGRQEQGIGNDNAGNDNASDHDDSLNSLNVPDSLNVPTCVLSKLFQPFHVTFWNRTQDPRCIPKVQR